VITPVLRILKAFIRTLLQAIPTVLCIVVVDFFLLKLAPGDAADALAGESGSATAETMAMLRERFGLDQPVLAQLIGFLKNLFNFSLGYSPLYNMSVGDLIAERLPNSLALMAVAMILSVTIGILMGVVMASFAGRWPDRVVSTISLLLYSVPGFWIGLMLIVLFSVWLNWLPSGGVSTIGANLSGLDALWDRLVHLMLPGLALATLFIAIYARLVRASMLEVASQDFVRTATAKGLSTSTVTFRHILRNALLPITTVAGMHIGLMLGGTVVVETVFSWPGLGRLALEAVLKRDFSVLLGVLLLSSLVVIAMNLLIDILQAWLDPRIELRS
jgi:peptide/nickel transport system permease protein